MRPELEEPTVRRDTKTAPGTAVAEHSLLTRWCLPEVIAPLASISALNGLDEAVNRANKRAHRNLDR